MKTVILAAVLTVLLVGACGQKGPLRPAGSAASGDATRSSSASPSSAPPTGATPDPRTQGTPARQPDEFR